MALVGLVMALAVGVLLFFAVRSERIQAYSVEAVVLDDGSALVRETIDYDFGSNSKHGIVRDIPERLGSGDAESRVTHVEVRSATAPAHLALSETSSGAEIRIGDPDRTISGRHRYVIEYLLTGMVVDRRLALNAIGTGWEVPIAHARVKVYAPFALTDAKCNRGASGSRASCDHATVNGDLLDADVDQLDAREGITIYADAGDPATDPTTALPTDVDLEAGSDPGWWQRAITLVLGIGAIGYAIGLIPATLWARRAGRDIAWHGEGGAVDAVFGGPELPARPIDDVVADKQTTIQFVPPPGLTPAQGGLLLCERVTDDHRVAWLTQQAIDGWLEFRGGGTVLRRIAPPAKWKSAPAPLRRIFRDNQRVSLDAYHANFAEGWKMIEADLTKWQRTCGLWDGKVENRSLKAGRRVLWVAIGAAVIGGAALVFTVASLLWAAVAVSAVSSILVGAGAAAMINTGELAVRTPEGFAKRQLVEGFRRFFEVSEGRHAREAAERGDLRLYSAWAVALGELGRWNDAMSSAALPPSTPGVSDTNNFVLFSAATHTATTPPRESSGGSGGSSHSSYSGSSGGVDGGAGGGGGGSW